MHNVVRLHDERWRKPKIKDDPAAALADLAVKVAQLAQQPIATKEHMQQSIFLIALSIARVRQFISLIQDCEARARLFDHTERIQALVEVARQKAALL